MVRQREEKRSAGVFAGIKADPPLQVFFNESFQTVSSQSPVFLLRGNNDKKAGFYIWCDYPVIMDSAIYSRFIFRLDEVLRIS